MRILVTGANGFIGQVLLRRLLADGLAGQAVDQIVAVDLSTQGLPEDWRVRSVVGSMASPGVLESALQLPVDCVFHLASLPGGAAERDPVLSRQVNLEASWRLLDLLGQQARAPRLVFASTVAVYGDPLPAWVDEQTPAQPAMVYGAHKLASEILMADASRRGQVNACCLRLPGVVARPGDGAGLMSAFMSQLFWRLSQGRSIVLPVSADGTAWWISAQACVANLIHAAELEPSRLPPTRVVQMPALHLSMAEVVQALADSLGGECSALVTYQPQALVQRLFASYPPLSTPLAQALGFRHDGSAAHLVQRAMQG